MTRALSPFIPAGTDQIRVIGFTSSDQVVGAFSDAVSVVLGEIAGGPGGNAPTMDGQS